MIIMNLLSALALVLQANFLSVSAFAPSRLLGKFPPYHSCFPSHYHHRHRHHQNELLFDACWEAETLTVNPLDDTSIETILQRICSPAPQSYYVIQRATTAAILSDQSSESNTLSTTLGQLQYLIKPGYQYIVHENSNEFEIVPTGEPLRAGWHGVVGNLEDGERSTLEASHKALEVITSGRSDAVKELQKLVERAKSRLHLTQGTDLRGRLSADAAFSFAMAGVTDIELYDMLAAIARNEFQRLGKRPSFRSKYILQMVEKLAASGMRGVDVYRVAAESLQFKSEHLDVVEMLLSSQGEDFDLLSTRPLLWLWRFSSRQSKVVPKDSANYNSNWINKLHDCEKSLVVDIGCGMGVSLLGLATTLGHSGFAASPEGRTIDYADWNNSNLVGCDLNSVTIGYAQGIAKRWNLRGRLQYTHHSAHTLLEEIESSYSGAVPLVMIQFPSPYRFQNKDVGNKQLPSVENGFMVSRELLCTVARILQKSGGFLLLQSNVEDVAVAMRNLALDIGMESIIVPQPRSLDDFDDYQLPQRTLAWIQAGGERAVGDDWSVVPLLPARGATETEVACQFQGTPVHRCLFRVRKVPQ